MAMVSGMVEIGQIWRALGRDKATTLPVFHAFTGADNVGRFSGVGKMKWLQHYINAERNIVKALMKLPKDDDLTQEVKVILASVVCLSYCQKLFRSPVSLTSDGICFANIWQKVATSNWCP